MLSNPARFFVTGNDTEKFTYEGGTKLYHFCPKDFDLSGVYNCNIIFLANDPAHAKDVLVRMLRFGIDCLTRYKSGARDRHDFAGEAVRKIGKLEWWLGAVLQGKALPVEAPTNQVYQVGWAENDTIL